MQCLQRVGKKYLMDKILGFSLKNANFSGERGFFKNVEWIVCHSHFANLINPFHCMPITLKDKRVASPAAPSPGNLLL